MVQSKFRYEDIYKDDPSPALRIKGIVSNLKYDEVILFNIKIPLYLIHDNIE
jgi:hypothetical protein